jgi:hypothetical protein
MSTVTVGIVQHVAIDRTIPDASPAAVGAAVADVVASLTTATGLDWTSLSVSVADDQA